jgi:hypothetical protein
MGRVTVEAEKNIITLGRKNAMGEVLLVIAVLIILFLFYKNSEVKTGSSSLNTRERQVRNVVKQRAVEWEELRLPSVLSQIRTSPKERLSSAVEGRLCRHCGRENREQARFCGHCGEPL